MLDRQDIDALLIGSLYGELSSADEARLAAHLESHPADRTALSNLSRAREVVRESRILQVQFEPPQSISALLMQEAVRRAPKPREEQGWFQRFMRSFMTHPAMAAAAMLVLIIGVAGTVYMRKGDHFANPTTEQHNALAPATESPPGAAPAEEAQNELSKVQQQVAQGSATGDNYRVQLDEGALMKSAEDKAGDAPADVLKADPSANRERNQNAVVDAKKNKKGGELAFDASERRAAPKVSKQTADENAGFAQPPKEPPAKTAAKPVSKPPRLEVTTPTQAPKDFESTTATTTRGAGEAKKSEPDGVAVGGAGGATGASAPRSPAVVDSRPAAPPPPPSAPVPATVEDRAPAKPDPQLAWAKEQHGKVIAAVKAGNCQTAANLAVQISNRAPAYYASNVETDRTIKQCMQYITAEREKEAERTRRMKATQRRAADEAPAPAKSSTK